MATASSSISSSSSSSSDSSTSSSRRDRRLRRKNRDPHRLRFLLLHLLHRIRLLHRRVATAVFAERTGTRIVFDFFFFIFFIGFVFLIVASRPPSSPKEQGLDQDPQEEGVAIEARKKASQRIVASRPPYSPKEQGLDQPILPLLPLRPITADHVSVPDHNNFIPPMETGEDVKEDLEKVKVVIHLIGVSLKTDVAAKMRNDCNMLKEEIVNLFSQTMDKVEDRFDTRLRHNYRLVGDRVAAVERHISKYGSEINRVVVQMKAQLNGWNVLSAIGQPSCKGSDK
ncbi:hypothetical protein Syun_030040 [Stephania yunnanensis]|uniref:Uncharacterized protein n=1 Tax=Stephania yunnanensis TaxID=152371 RepID=A0AAP0HKE9_9MAGN